MIVGVDEVGRGAWAGPLVAGAVLLDAPILGLRDSKKLTKLQRQRLSAVVLEQAVAYGIGWVSAHEVDEFGLTQAVRLAMQRAVAQIRRPYQQIIVDGHFNFLAAMPHSQAVIKADDTVPAVSAASIIAKVARDTYMAQLPKQYKAYGFAANVGYGTAAHHAALRQVGVSDLHRRSFKPVWALLQ